MDAYLDKKVRQYDNWLKKGGITHASKVIPVSQSLEAREWVLPSEQVLDILAKAESFAVQNCECRTRYGYCDAPLEVCFLLNKTSDRYVRDGKARRLDLDEAKEILKKANEAGLVHLTLFMPHNEIFALCSCCACCCHDFQIIRQTGRKEIMARSDYTEKTDADLCIACGDCVPRCAFDARVLDSTGLAVDADACLGCGLCVTACPTQAISMVPRDQN